MLITEKDKQNMGRSIIYSRESCITKKALEIIEGLPVLEELDTGPTREEITKSIHALACGKATGEVSMPPEDSKYRKPALFAWVVLTPSLVLADRNCR